MKVAVCVSGQLRTFEKTFPSLSRYFLQPFECDVFLSTWNDAGLPKSSAPDEALPKAGELYKPVKMEVESWAAVRGQWGDLSGLEARKRQDANIDSITGMFYKIWRANELKRQHEQETGIVYDRVVRSRPDVLYYESPEFEIDAPNHIFVGNRFGYGGIPDLFAFGPSRLMDVYSSLVQHISTYSTQGCVVHPETLLQWHIGEHLPHGILFSRVPFRLLRDGPDTYLSWMTKRR